MNILFLTLGTIKSVKERGLYTDLMREFSKNGHKIFIVSPMERRFKQKTKLVQENNVNILNVKTLNITKTNFIEKGIATLLIENQYFRAVKKYFFDVKFDLILYSTPPITFTKIIRKIKQTHNAKSYLLLKDIFPQNAGDIGMMKPMGFIHSFFRKKEIELYKLSDHIGCMSPANVEYVKKHNPETANKIEVCPNSIEPVEFMLDAEEKKAIRVNWEIPSEAAVFVYGGNLGKPQGVDFLLDILNSNNNKPDRYFLIVGSGTEYQKIKSWFDKNNYSNAKLLSGLPKIEYDKLLQACDIGLIFLDSRFTIPNYPSRLLSYLEYKMPILTATDPNTDIGTIAQENKYGFAVENGDLKGFNDKLEKFISDKSLISEMGNSSYQFLLKNYTAKNSYDIVMKHFD
jgi:glycosyltransferase involved in cell wall biosynthesis